jgi:hypothetical protein
MRYAPLDRNEPALSIEPPPRRELRSAPDHLAMHSHAHEALLPRARRQCSLIGMCGSRQAGGTACVHDRADRHSDLSARPSGHQPQYQEGCRAAVPGSVAQPMVARKRRSPPAYGWGERMTAGSPGDCRQRRPGRAYADYFPVFNAAALARYPAQIVRFWARRWVAPDARRRPGLRGLISVGLLRLGPGRQLVCGCWPPCRLPAAPVVRVLACRRIDHKPTDLGRWNVRA